MSMAETDSGFLARWARRKTQARTGVAEPEVAEPPERDGPSTTTAATSAEPLLPDAPQATTPECEVPAQQPPVAPDEPALTLADVARLTRESDFSPFMASNVQTEVKNAALKKLFTDPHFNLMDGLDVYIDDYGVPDPLPQSMLLKMAQAKFLGLLTDAAEEKLEGLADLLTDDAADTPPAQNAPAAPPAEPIVSNENADLQLQPHDEPGRAGTAPGSGQDTGREH